jgi:lipase chaperone LimK
MFMLITAMTASASTPSLTIEINGQSAQVPDAMAELGFFINSLDQDEQKLIAQNFSQAVEQIKDEGSDLTGADMHAIYADLADNLYDDLGEDVGGALLDLDAMSIIDSASETTSLTDWRQEWTGAGMGSLIPLFTDEEPEPEYSLFTKTMALGVGLIGGALGAATGNPAIIVTGVVAGVTAGEAIGEAIENIAEGEGEEEVP